MGRMVCSERTEWAKKGVYGNVPLCTDSQGKQTMVPQLFLRGRGVLGIPTYTNLTTFFACVRVDRVG
jgi:hypothetical protein